VAALGGCARFYSDNGFVCGPPDVVWPAIAQFSAALENLNLVFRMDKGECTSPNGAYGDRPVEMPIGSLTRVVDGEETVGYGINVCNIPVGDAVYVEHALDQTCTKIEHKINSISEKLSKYPNESWTCLYYASAHQWDYWMQNLQPAVTAPFSRRIDAAVLAAMHRATGIANFDGYDISQRRVELPARMRGLGLRSHFRSALSAFVGTVNQTVTRFVDQVKANGDVVVGFFSCLVNAVGAGSFDAGGGRYTAFIANGSPIALALRDAWNAMRDEIGEVPAGSPPEAYALESTVEGACGSQRELTCAVEIARCNALNAEILALSNDNPHNRQRKLAWVSVDRASNVWVTCCPSGVNRAGPQAFREIACRYMGLTSPCARALIGQTIWSSTGDPRGVCDPYGTVLTSSTLAGDGWRTAHDAIKNAIVEICVAFKLDYTCEVFGLFSSCIAAGPRRDAYLALKDARHPGMVPDFRFDDLSEALGGGGPAVAGTQRLAELKRINQGPTNYPPAVFGGRMVGVTRRAGKLQREYEVKAQRLDVNYGVTPPGEYGPCCDRLASYGAVLGLVVGHFGEWSPDLNRLVGAMAMVAVPRVGRLYSALGEERAKATLVNKARRDIAWAGLNANAKLLLDRAGWVGQTFVAATRNQEAMKRRISQRRQAARDANNDEHAQAAVRQGFEIRGRAYYADRVGG